MALDEIERSNLGADLAILAGKLNGEATRLQFGIPLRGALRLADLKREIQTLLDRLIAEMAD